MWMVYINQNTINLYLMQFKAVYKSKFQILNSTLLLKYISYIFLFYIFLHNFFLNGINVSNSIWVFYLKPTYLLAWHNLVTLKSPKSVITTLSLSKKMFLLFKSLCTIPLACRYPIPWKQSKIQYCYIYTFIRSWKHFFLSLSPTSI